MKVKVTLLLILYRIKIQFQYEILGFAKSDNGADF